MPDAANAAVPSPCATVDPNPADELLALLAASPEHRQAILDHVSAFVRDTGSAAGVTDALASLVRPFGVVIGQARTWTRQHSIDPTFPGIAIGLRFLDGADDLKSTVMGFVKAWEDVFDGRIVFREVAAGRAVTITFTGAYNLTEGVGPGIMASTPSMLLPDVQGDDLRSQGVTLHEFGHLLGLSHEHFNPGLAIQWKSDQDIADVINRDLPPRRKWTTDMVHKQITRRPAGAHTCPIGSPFDASSIMAYPISQEWNNSGIEIAPNRTISDEDRACIRELYASLIQSVPPQA